MGIERAGFRHLSVVECDSNARATIETNNRLGNYSQKWPLHQEPDARKVDYTGFRGQARLVAGGPPCQPWSMGGLHKGYKDERDLFPEAVRAVREIEPHAFLFENVRGLTRQSFAEYVEYVRLQMIHPWLPIKSDEDWPDHLASLQRIDGSGIEPDGHVYNVNIAPIHCADFGTPQSRNRVIFAGVRSDLGTEWKWPQITHSLDALLWSQYVSSDYWTGHDVKERQCPPRLKERVKKLKEEGNAPKELPWVTVRDTISRLPNPAKVLDRTSMERDQHVLIPGARTYKGHTGSPLDWPAKTLKAGVHGVPGGENMLRYDNGQVRYFTVRESALLQGFHAGYVFEGSWVECMRQIGNAVPVMVAEQLGKVVRDLLESNV